MHLNLQHLPSPDERLVLEGGRINPVWYAWLKGLEKALHDADLNTLEHFEPSAITNGWTIRWDAAQQRWVPGV